MSCQGAVSPKGARKLHDADVVYLYDGSFEGFLCCVYESFAQHELPFAVWTPQRETATLYPVKDIATDPAVARRVFASFGKKLGAETEYLVSRDFLSGQEDKELLLLRFLHLSEHLLILSLFCLCLLPEQNTLIAGHLRWHLLMLSLCLCLVLPDLHALHKYLLLFFQDARQFRQLILMPLQMRYP